MLMFFQNRAVSGASTLSKRLPVAHRSCGSLEENGLVALQSRNTLPLAVGCPVMNEWRPLSEWHRCTSASCPRSANVKRRAPIRREIGSRDTQSCTVSHFDPRAASHHAVDEVEGRGIAHPAVLHVVEGNEVGVVSFVGVVLLGDVVRPVHVAVFARAHGRIEFRHAAQVLDADFLDPARDLRSCRISPPPQRFSIAQVIGASIVIVSP